MVEGKTLSTGLKSLNDVNEENLKSNFRVISRCSNTGEKSQTRERVSSERETGNWI